MKKAIWLVALVACSAEPETSTQTSAIQQANGLTTNGIWENGIWENGIWENGIWENGIWENGIWENGIWENGIWENGIWENGIWENGIWENGIWENGVQADALRNNPYAAKLLQYVYSCAMPAMHDGVSMTTTVGPSDARVTLTGAIGIAINADNTSWWESGTCDESCQRWISACVLARTNAYGVNVQISMRAPTNAPQKVKDALALVGDEGSRFPLREGAFYGNLFQTTPLQPGTDGPAIGPIVTTPSFYACAGPGSNIPEITKRFCSSQGDQSVINVTGVCRSNEAVSTPTDACTTFDANGAMQGCKAGTRVYDEVITVYIHELIAVCGNAVCENGETDQCSSDCTPGTSGESFASAFSEQSLFPSSSQLNLAINPDNTFILAGTSNGPLDFGGGAQAGGNFALVKLDANGGHLWTRRSSPGIGYVRQVKVSSNGTITVSGHQGNQTWLARFDANGTMLPGWPLVLSSAGSSGQNGQNIGLDAEDNIFVTAHFGGTTTFVTQPPTTLVATANLNAYIAKVSAAGTLLWVKDLGNFDYGFPPQLAVNKQGDAFVADSARLDTQQAHFYKVSGADGRVLWNSQFRADLGQFCALTTDSRGDVYIAGTLESWVGNYVAKLSTETGELLWLEQQQIYRPSAVCHGGRDYLSLTPDESNVIVAMMHGGFFNSNYANLGAGLFNTYATSDIAIAAYATANTLPVNGRRFQWAKPVPLVLNGYHTAMQVAPDGRVVLSGTFSGSMVIDNRLLVSTNPQESSHMNAFFGAFVPPPPGDTTPPVMGHVPETRTIEATSATGTESFFMLPTAIDGGNAGTNVSCLPTPFSELSIGTHTVRCTATDPKGNASTTSFQIIVRDTMGPLISNTPETIEVDATGSSGAVVTFPLPTALDQVDGARNVTCFPASGSTFPIGETTVTCSAGDTRGNATHTSFAVVVTVPPTSLPPVIAVPSTITATATSSAGATVSYSASATDDFDGAIAVNCAPPSGATFGLGSTTVTCTAIDSHLNVTTTTFAVNVLAQWSGILQPINADGSSIFKKGQTIAVKFRLAGASAGITDAVAHLSLAKISNNIVGSVVEATSTSAADTGNQFRYDTAAQQYIFNLSTSGLTTGTYELRIDLHDGVAHTVIISLKP